MHSYLCQTKHVENNYLKYHTLVVKLVLLLAVLMENDMVGNLVDWMADLSDG